MKFEEFGLHNEVLAGVKAAGFKECMEVQAKVLAESLTGQDIMVQSKTGSGKTAAFVLTFLEEYIRRKEQGLRSMCLIVAPTRELAQQISSDAKILSKGIKDFKVGCFYGGVGYESQYRKLAAGCDICVGTPGRLIEFLKNGKLDGSKITSFVIDEADRLFDMGFYPDIKQMFRLISAKENRQTMLFSATLEMRVRDLAWEFMNTVKEIDLEPDTVTVDQISQELYHVAKSEKFYLFLQLLAVIKPKTALVFTNSRFMAGEVSARLKLNGYKADHLSGDMTQALRDKALKNIKSGETQILVATDVAARGLQIDDLPLVVNYDIPEDYENYVHRIGRTARAGKSGRAVTLADEEFVYGLEAIEKFIKMKIPVIWPENLPEVEDLSIGKSWNDRPERTRKPTVKNTDKNVEKNIENSSKKKQNNSQIKKPKSLGQMSEEERIEYYKKKYGFVPASETKTQENKMSDEERVKKESAEVKGIKCVPVRFAVLGIICLVLFVVGFFLSLFFDIIFLKKVSRKIKYYCGFIASKIALFFAGADIRVYGNTSAMYDLIAKKMPICFISNHTSLLDVPAMFAGLHVNTGFIAKKEYLYMPVINIIIFCMNSVFIDRNNTGKGKHAIRKGEKNISKGIPMTIYPEGSRSKTGKINPFKRGSYRLATESGAVMIPITLKNFRSCCEEREKTFQGKRICYINVGDPVQAPDASDREAVAKAADNVEKQIRDAFETLGKNN